MFKKTNKAKFLTVLLIFTLLLPILILQSDFNSKIKIKNDNEQINGKEDGIKLSAIITNEIRINGSARGVGAHNWTWAKNEEYVSQGDGSQSNPYIISNLELDCQNSHSGIVIEDSIYNEVAMPIYFRIENNIIYNVGGPNSHSAGVKIERSRYGLIRNNNISSNRDGNYGIHIVGKLMYMPAMPESPDEDHTSKEINITTNYISKTERGIYLQNGCKLIIISENIVEKNSLAGIYVARKCLQIQIIENILTENDVFGIADTDSNNHNMPNWPITEWEANKIKNNIIYNNAYGLYLSQTKGSRISYNNISSNSITGVYISGAYWNYIANNTISDNGDKGILMVMGPIGSFKNRIYGNEFLNNKEHAVELTSQPPIYIDGGWENNWTWWQGVELTSPLLGNYWDNYTGKDADDDGFGDAFHNFIGNKDIRPIWNDGIEGHVIEIDGLAVGVGAHNWTWAMGRFWCKGSGMMMLDPCIIGPNENWNGKIDAWGKQIGISIKNSNAIHFQIKGNNIFNASVAGIKLTQVSTIANAILNNNISNNHGYGIYFNNVDKMNITNNIINENSKTGIYLYNGSGYETFAEKNNINENTILANDVDGISLRLNCDNNDISSNLIAENGQYGVNLNETTGLGCNNTFLYNNIFRDNTFKNAYDNGTNTKWYEVDFWGYGRGNSWHDYDGFDGDDDGIGDTGVYPYPLKPYNIYGPRSSKDYYPIKDDGLNVKELVIDDWATGIGAHNWTWASKRLYVSGSGFAWDPYVINNVKFNGTNSKSAITIKNSLTKDFIIQNCTLVDIGGSDSGKAGIYLYNTKNGELINNTFSTNYEGNYGIFLQKCEEINITANKIENANFNPRFKYGIYFNRAGDTFPNVVDRNIIRHNEIGILLTNQSSHNNITNNEIIDNYEITENINIGIFINDSSRWNNIYYNEIIRNGNGTILKNGANDNYIVNNNIKDNDVFGLYINSSDNDIYYNSFEFNGINAKDDENPMLKTNRWYSNMNFRGNSWDDYTDMGSGAKDQDDDGIGDISYNLTGIAKAQDPRPIFNDGHNGSKVVIDGSLGGIVYGSWGWAASRTWCSGSGTSNDPYIISGLHINGRLNSSCIYIHDSQSVYFRIQNCNLFNSSETASPEPAGGIRLIEVSNAIVYNNTINNNDGCGIILMSGAVIGEPTTNNTIRNNHIENNNGTGIYFNGSFVYDNLIDNNTILSNKIYGISVSNNAYENIISNNTLVDNEEIGIYVKDFQPSYPMPPYMIWDKNYIYYNKISGGDTGIGVESSRLVYILGNSINLTESNGIALQGINCGNNTISQNAIYGNLKYGINFGWNRPSSTVNNYILENDIYDNGASGIILQQCYGSNFSKNTLDGNSIGIALSFLNSYNLFTQNKFFNNFDRGLGIYDLSCEGNRIYNNNFTGNYINGEDLGLSNEWCFDTPNLKDGNYWDDYLGNDTNDNGIGDTPYDNIGGFMRPKDYFPKWWDAPVIEVLTPSNGEIFSSTPPNFEVRVKQGLGLKLWYVITQTGATSYFDFNTNPKSGQISSTIWNILTGSWDGIIRFYVNDSRGYKTFIDIDIIKENATTPIPPTSSGDDGGTTTTITAEQQLEEDFPWWLRAILTGIISASAGLALKVTYSVHKHRKEFLRKVAENMERIDNIEKFLKTKLGTDWNKFQESWDKYQKQEITQKKLIKEGRKNVGKKFLDIFTKSKK